MVGTVIRNEVNQRDKAIGSYFRQKDRISGDMIWGVFEKVSQSNASFNALDKLVIEFHSIRMLVGFWKAIKTNGRPLSVMAHLERSIVEAKAE
jgi:hypothetical protein